MKMIIPILYFDMKIMDGQLFDYRNDVLVRIDIMCFSVTGDNQNWQLLSNNHDNR